MHSIGMTQTAMLEVADSETAKIRLAMVHHGYTHRRPTLGSLSVDGPGEAIRRSTSRVGPIGKSRSVSNPSTVLADILNRALPKHLIATHEERA